MRKLLLVSVLAFSIFFSNAQQDSLPSFIKDSLDNYINTALHEWQIPGAAICIIKDGKIVVMKGYGVRELGSTELVDQNTLFMIGSNTKAFTATALAMLQAENKLSLNDKVQKWLPDFKMYDPWVSKEVIVRDLLCHRLGFETFQGDFMYFDSDLTKEEVRAKMALVKPVYSFRSRWGYCNAAFLTAGEIIPKVTGQPWNVFVTENIFKPLGMDRSLALASAVPTASNMAAAHTLVKGQLRKIPFGKIDNLASAGSISSSVNDLSHWVSLQLNDGMYDGKRVIPAQAIRLTREPNSIMGGGSQFFNRGNFTLYGLGWVLEDYQGKKIVSHTGGVNGFVTSVTLIPEEKLGIVVLTNTDANVLYEALKWEVLDAFLKLPYRGYSKVFLKGFNEQQQAEQLWLQKKKDTISMAMDTISAVAYAGEYKSEVYGKMNISQENGKLIARFEHHKGRFAELQPLSPGRVLASFNDPLYGIKEWEFKLVKGKPVSVTVRVADFVEFTTYEFIKIK